MILSSFSNIGQNRVDLSPDYIGGQRARFNYRQDNLYLLLLEINPLKCHEPK